MRHLTYLALLAACLLGTLPLELVIGARVYRQWRRVVGAVFPVAAAFIVWDWLAVRAGWWSFDRRYILGVRLGLPLEELLFFVVVPFCAILTLEAVHTLRPDWALGADAAKAAPTGAQPAPERTP
ncbi:MAG: lycopene cyclase domain-containing protein [bacterium]